MSVNRNNSYFPSATGDGRELFPIKPSSPTRRKKAAQPKSTQPQRLQPEGNLRNWHQVAINTCLAVGFGLTVLMHAPPVSQWMYEHGWFTHNIWGFPVF